MRVIPASLHRLLDFVTVIAFALAPSVLHLSGFAGTLAYLLAGVHFALTMVTQFPGARLHLVSLPLHGAIECLVGLVLVALPWVAGWSGTPRTFYVAAGVVILVVWVLSHYGASDRAAAD
ncbi:MAG TPA: hypothetical protein VH163_01460 [Gemmatimonadales bacterium]|jgi:hypothetical protein|nr:hypothetical protein [Gemmatimonadales bacterium]